jgi:glycine betaine catabolism A
MTRRIAIVGGGQFGLCSGIGLLAAGHQVTIVTNRTSQQILDGKLTSTCVMLGDSTRIERELGLGFWDEGVPRIDGVFFQACDAEQNVALNVRGRYSKSGQAIDQRLKHSVWLDAFERRGGTLKIAQVSPDDLEQYAAEYDLVVLAAGSAGLSQVLERDLEKSPYSEPQRRVGAVSVLGKKPWKDIPFSAMKQISVAGGGELLYIPFFTKDCGPCTIVTCLAMIGGRMDTFAGTRTPEELLSALKAIVHDVTPWDDDVLADTRPTDATAWIIGGVTPGVRRPVLRLPSGKCVLVMGDASVSNDPLAGQGAQLATKAARLLLKRVAELGSSPCTAEWMQSVFDQFWSETAEASTGLSNGVLGELAPFQLELFERAQTDDRIASRIFDGYNDPNTLFPWFADPDAARVFLEEMHTSGEGDACPGASGDCATGSVASEPASVETMPGADGESPAADGEPSHFVLNGGATPPSEYFVGTAQYAREQMHIFKREWLCVAHVDSLRTAGDFVTREVAGQLVLLVRSGSHVCAFHNLCRHRGCKLVEEPAGQRRGFACPYHRWAYDTAGKLMSAPGTQHLKQFRAEDHSLRPILVEVRFGLVFICFAESPPDLDAHLGQDFASFAVRYELASLRSTVRKDYDVKANWKLIVHNINECLHFPVLHSDLHRVTDFDASGTHHLSGNVIGAWQSFRDSVKALSMSGDTDRRPMPAIVDAERQRVNWITLLPNLLFAFTSDYVMMQWVWPQGPARSKVWNEWYFHPDAVARPGFSHDEVFALWDKANYEDWSICERNHEGVQSPGWTPGTYALDEEVLFDFDQYVARCLQSG